MDEGPKTAPSKRYGKPADLPAILPVFPLPGALLFAREQLPLNVFEPRYLQMVDDALGLNEPPPPDRADSCLVPPRDECPT